MLNIYHMPADVFITTVVLDIRSSFLGSRDFLVTSVYQKVKYGVYRT